MQRLISSAVLLFVVRVTTSSLAAEVQIDQHTLCPAALHAFDAKDSEVVQEFFQFIHNVFSELDAQYTDGGERALSKRLQDRSVAGYVVLGRCHQHPAPRSTRRQYGPITACARWRFHWQMSPPSFRRQVRAIPAFGSNDRSRASTMGTIFEGG
jgi:hypothetical protein